MNRRKERKKEEKKGGREEGRKERRKEKQTGTKEKQQFEVQIVAEVRIQDCILSMQGEGKAASKEILLKIFRGKKCMW